MARRSLRDGAGAFEVTVLQAEHPARVVLFGAGLGGNPERHLPLLEARAARGCAVVAPHFERLPSPTPSAAELRLRAGRMRLALESAAPATLPVAGVGHSLGASMLLAFAGAALGTLAGERLVEAPLARLDRLALMAPAIDFVRAPGALDAVHTPILAWAGTSDPWSPPSQVRLLQDRLASRGNVEVRAVDGAGHFSFMNLPPPRTTEPLPDRDAFLARLTEEVAAFVVS